MEKMRKNNRRIILRESLSFRVMDRRKLRLIKVRYAVKRKGFRLKFLKKISLFRTKKLKSYLQNLKKKVQLS
jgi:hypothetical protein